MRFIAVLIAASLLSACATINPPVVDTSCDWVRPIYVSKQDTLTDKTAREILSHDNKWQKICGNKKDQSKG